MKKYSDRTVYIKRFTDHINKVIHYNNKRKEE